jgi:hypothetical protein
MAFGAAAGTGAGGPSSLVKTEQPPSHSASSAAPANRILLI